MYEGSGQVVHDLSGHGNNGQLGSTPGVDANDPTWIKGILFGSALRFSGNQFVRIPDSTSLEPTDLTISAWVRSGSSPGIAKQIVGKGASDCDASSYALYTGVDGGLTFYVATADHKFFRTSSIAAASIWNNKWHHVAGTFDSSTGTAKLFVDGKQIGDSTAVSGPIGYDTPNTGDMGFGNYFGTCDLFYTGDIDEVALFSQALPIDKYYAALALLFPKPLR
ncbi:MAG TPA: LamG domain-containing protein [Baekduia sp.]|uniref:LamG domain-containing protein n=1 Tax=Baekduia sp. TaxID=2600305 RepID=UPI002D7A3C5E|nr:LamG domain-containing protein [Baekduia sp.]HET6506023.1 LamG domain-containing protein [Baekduia sp.]